MKILINGVEVVCSNDFTIEQEMLSTPSVVLNNVYPKTWENDKDYVSRFYYPEDYSKCLIYESEPFEFEILGETTQDGTPTPNNPVPITTKTGTIYETINGKQYQFNLGDIELCQIGGYQDKIYKSNGIWYLHKEIGKVVLNGSENIGISQYPVLSGKEFDIANNLGAYNSSEILMLSNYFKGIAFDDRADNSESIYSQDDASRITILTNVASNVLDFATWLSNNNTTVYYVLKTPTDTKITDPVLLKQLDVGTGLIFAGVVENTGNISLNPREPHFCNLQILDFKTFLSEGELDTFVIYQKTITEAINMIVNNIADYGFVVGNIDVLNPNDIIGAYSTKDKTAYDMFQYIADITQSRWTTRMIDADTVAIDFYDPTLMPEGTEIEYTKEWFEANDIHDMSFSYSSRDYRNKQVMTSNEIYGSISQNEQITANGYQTQFNVAEKIGTINSIKVNGVEKTVTTNEQKELGITADFYYTSGNNYFESDSTLTAGQVIVISYVPLVVGRQVITNQTEINRINTAINRKGVVSRYENRNDATTSNELKQIGQSYIKYKGTPEVTLTVESGNNIWDVGETVEFTAPLSELSTNYMVKKKSINYLVTADDIVYTYELTSSFNSETEINYFDNQRAKNNGNIGKNETEIRNIDIESTANIIFYGLETEEITTTGDNVLDSVLDSPINN